MDRLIHYASFFPAFLALGFVVFLFVLFKKEKEENIKEQAYSDKVFKYVEKVLDTELRNDALFFVRADTNYRDSVSLYIGDVSLTIYAPSYECLYKNFLEMTFNKLAEKLEEDAGVYMKVSISCSDIEDHLIYKKECILKVLDYVCRLKLCRSLEDIVEEERKNHIDYEKRRKLKTEKILKGE